MLETYIIRINRNLSEHEYQQLQIWISPEKRLKLKQYFHFIDAQHTLLGDILVRKLIHKHFYIKNNEIIFDTNAYGKPFLKNHLGFHYNISHAGNYVVCVVGDKPVGIDVEIYETVNLKTAEIIADRFFTDDETEYIFSQTGIRRKRAFLQIWTMKESYIKHNGKGLNIPLRSFSVLCEFDICFHHIFENGEAISHICTDLGKEQPSVFELTVSALLLMYNN